MRYFEERVGKDDYGHPEKQLHWNVKRIIADAAIGVGAITLVFGSWFTIDQTEMGNIRRLGTRVYDQPLGPGLHFKFPIIDSVDRLRITLNTIHIDPFMVSTNDNQQVTLGINYNYTIPAAEVNHLLYGVGGPGNGDIHEQAIAVVKDRASWVFAGQNMVTVNSNRPFIQNQIETEVHKRLQTLLGIEPHSLQISEIQPSESFMHSNEAAVNAKNAAVAAENQKRTKQFEADQAVIEATGAANSIKAKADGDAYAVRVAADAEAYRLKTESAGLAVRVAAFGGPAMYNDWIRAQAWKGEVPQYMGSGAIPFLNLNQK